MVQNNDKCFGVVVFFCFVFFVLFLLLFLFVLFFCLFVLFMCFCFLFLFFLFVCLFVCFVCFFWFFFFFFFFFYCQGTANPRQTYKMTCASWEDSDRTTSSDQSLRCLISVLSTSMKKPWVLGS